MGWVTTGAGSPPFALADGYAVVGYGPQLVVDTSQPDQPQIVGGKPVKWTLTFPALDVKLER